jgi:pathogenesis-related protein 1
MHYLKVASAISLAISYAVGDAFQDQVLAAHNVARAQYGAANLTWNAALYSSTLAYANTCVFAHSVCLSSDNSNTRC